MLGCFKQNRKIKGSAITYAITFMLLVGLICSGLLFIAGVNKRIEAVHLNKEYLIFDNASAIQIASSNFSRDSIQLQHESGDTSLILMKAWGAFDIAFVKTFKNSSTLHRSAILGAPNTSELPSLFLCDLNQALKITGDSKIEGTAYLPERGVERAYIAGKTYSGKELVYGTIKKSESMLPKLKANVSNITIEDYLKHSKKIDLFSHDSVFSFQHKTALISEINSIEISQSISGNIIIHSFDSIYVRNSAHLQHVILIAPKVRFESGFEGSVQVIAHQTITCEKEVKLLYPSTLYLNEIEPGLEKSAISLDEKAMVLGGILIIAQKPDFRKEPLLKVEKEALVGGLVYNCGETSLYGKIVGHLYTKKFLYAAGGGVYVNHLVDGIITSKELPKDFLLPHWLETMNVKQKKLIQCF